MSKKMKIQDIHALTPLQEGILFHSLMNKESRAYVEQLLVAAEGSFDLSCCEAAFRQMVARHDVCRTVYKHSGADRPLQIVMQERYPKLKVARLESLSPAEQLASVEQLRQEDRERGFDLTKDMPIRLCVMVLGERSFQLLLSFHHIILDGWSLSIFLQEFFRIYRGLMVNRPAELSAPFDYGAYMRQLSRQSRERAADYWRQALSGYETETALPGRKTARENGPYEAREYHFEFAESLTEKLTALAQRQGVTMNTVVQTLWGILLQKYSGSDDVAFGAVVSGRRSELPGIEQAVGMFINTIPVRIVSSGHTFLELLHQTRGSASEAADYEHYPLYEIQAEQRGKRAIIDHVLAFESFPLVTELLNGKEDAEEEMSVTSFRHFSQTNYDFNVVVFPGTKLSFRFAYNAHAYEESLVRAMEGHLKRLAETAAERPETPVAELDPLTEAEREALLEQAGGEEAAYPREATLTSLFEAQAERTPERTAVVAGGERMTYAELNGRANALARKLREQGVGPDERVGLLLGRSAETIVAMLAVLKAGGAYVPLDPAHPAERIAFMLGDSGARVVIADEAGAAAFGSGEAQASVERIIRVGGGEERKESEPRNPEPVHGPEHLAYVIYTSGTTGKPKGVMIEHRNVVRLLKNDRLPFAFGETDVWTAFHSFSFDFSVWEMYGALLYGGTCVIVPAETAQNPAAFLELLERERVTVLNQTPTAFYALAEEAAEGERGKELRLRYVIFGGDALQPAKLKAWKRQYPETKLINMYGITETTVHVTVKELTEREMDSSLSLIGRPIPTLRAYVLDGRGRLVPEGVTGELYVGGDGVARGYLNREELTAERFAASPFRSGERLYRSGDLVRRLPGGELAYVGRIDHQVKIRGYRIETGEIEHRLLEHGGVKEAVVLAVERGGETALCAYVVTEKAEEPGIAELRAHVAEALPGYMVPAYVVKLEKLPMTANGKTDRQALPLPEAAAGETPYEAPRNETEERLAALFEEVLELERVGIHDSFFELGGHSLKATKLMSKIKKQMGADIPLKAVFDHPTVAGLTDRLHADAGTSQAYAVIRPAGEREWYPVSSSQRRMLILNQMEEGTHYHITGAVMLTGPLDGERMERAVQAMLERHEMLRTSFSFRHGEPVQIIEADVPFVVESSFAKEEDLEETIAAFIRPFDLSKAPLFRARLVELEEERHVLIMDIHHIIADGTSLNLLLQEISRVYNGQELAPPRVQYKDYAVWELERERSEAYKAQEAFWLRTLAGELPVQQLPLDFPRPLLQSFAGEQLEFGLERGQQEAADRLMAETGTTPFMFWMAVFQWLLAKYGGQDDVIVGTPVAGRTQEDLQDMLGLFINTLAIRSRPAAEKTFEAYLREVKEASLQALEHQNYPFEQLIDKLGLPRDLSRNPLFDCMFIMQNAGTPRLDMAGVQADNYPLESRAAKFDLLLEATEREGSLAFLLQYNVALFKRGTVERMAGHFANIVRQVTANPETRFGELELVTESEKRQLLFDYNRTDIPYERDKTIARLFEEQAERTPDRVAIRFLNEELTYRELNGRANRLARVLREKGVGPERVVGVMLDRSAGLLAGLLAVLKAGGAYLPVDRELPADRVRYLLEDSRASLLLTRRSMLDDVSFGGEKLAIEEAWSMEKDGSNPEASGSGENPAYLIYTSGSTGKPKGVLIENRSVHNYMTGLKQACGLDGYRSILGLTTASFDIFVTETLLPLTCGMTVVMASEDEQKDPYLLSLLMDKYEVETMQTTPSRLQTLLGHPQSLSSIRKLKAMFVGGEAFPSPLLAALRANTSARIYNTYGPTETTVFSTVADLTNEERVHIGRPIANTQVYIVDSFNRLVPAGVAGELCIGGDGMARGYWQRDELTREKFAENPFNPGARMYRTGDSVRWTDDGFIEYLGRMDHQVKIRGYRIEPGEIEDALLAHPAVAKAAVVDREEANGDKYLRAYFVAEPGKQAEASELKAHLLQQLPAYMVPADWMRLDEMKLTPSGKIDRKALPEPAGRRDNARRLHPPATAGELKMEGIWKEILGVEAADIHESFFELGGHSLKAALLTAKIQESFGVRLSLKDVFRHQTIAELASLAERAERETGVRIEPAGQQPYYELSSAQHRMYFMQQLNGATTGYNLPSFVTVTGELDLDRIERTVQALVRRHEALRTFFEAVDGVLAQKVLGEADIRLERAEAKPSEADARIRGFIRPFDLDRGPLFRAGVIRCDANLHILMFDMHHIVSDGLSQLILRDEFIRLYNGEALPPLRLQYKDYAAWEQRRKQNGEYAAQEKYWLEKLGDAPVMDFPTDYVRPPAQSFEGASLGLTLEPELAAKLRKLAGESGATMYMLLLAGLHILLRKYSGQEDTVIGSPVAGRPHADLQPVIGMFVNMLAMRGNPAAGKTFGQFLDEVRDTAVEAYMNQDYAYEQLVEKLGLGKELNRNPLFDVVFAMQRNDAGYVPEGGVRFENYKWSHETAKFDLTLEAVESPERIDLTLQYAAGLFKRETAERLLRHYVRILDTACGQPSLTIGEIDPLTSEEKRQIVEQFNATAVSYPADATIHRLFEVQAATTPDKTAIHAEGRLLTYRELDERANRLAEALKRRGVGRDTVVALAAERTPEMFAAILAVLKAGGAYLPVDPELPAERIAYMLQDSGARLVLAETPYVRQLGDFAGEAIDLNEAFLGMSGEITGAAESLESFGNAGRSTDLAYIMYTSGSTGEPKGVMALHRGVVRLISGADYVSLREDDRILLTGATGFDATTFEIWGALLNGLTLYVVPKTTILQADLLRDTLTAHAITTMWLTAPLFNSLVQQREDLFAGLRSLIVGGDRLSPFHVRRALRGASGLRIINGYGPTENTTFSACYPISGREEGDYPIGKPISNSTAYILDAQGGLVPIGAAGELYVGGDGVARGYLNRPELTKEKFVPNPFEPGRFMYRTGDLAKWRPDGNIEYLGRIDDQIKIRGFRVEPGEIEAKLLAHPGVREAAVVARTEASGEKALCAYVAADGNGTVSEYRDYLAAELPSYMVPAYFVPLGRLPLNANGKVDRRQLPEPAAASAGSDAEYAAPRNETEACLAEVWEDVLGVSPVGIHHNFFQIGGDSIKAIQISSRLKQRGLRLDMRDLFLYPTVAKLAPFLRAASLTIPQEPAVGSAELTPIQRWFFECGLADEHHWNQSVMLSSSSRLDADSLEKTLRQLAVHHDALRMTYRREDGKPVQWNEAADAAERIRLETVDLTEAADESEVRRRIEAEASRLQGCLDLTHGPLMAAGLYRAAGEDHLLIAVHHLVVDGVSWRILLEDLAAGYEQAAAGREISLPEKTTSFRDWSAKLQAYAGSKALLKEERYWEALERIPLSPLPVDHDAAGNRSGDSRSVTVRLSEQETAQLSEAHRTYHTEMNDLLLAAFGKTLNEWLNAGETVIHLEGHGREEIVEQADVTRTVGWFTTMFPVALLGGKDEELGTRIVETKEMLRKIPNRGIGYGLLKYMATSHIRSSLGFRFRPESPAVSFNYLGEFALGAGTEPWGYSDMPAGPAVSPNGERAHKLDVIGMTAGGRLQFDFVYNGLEFEERTVSELSERFKADLLAVIRHCLQKEEELTPSDVGQDHDLSMEELQELSELLGGKIKM